MKQNRLYKTSILLLHAFAGWIYCGLVMGIARQRMSLHAALIVHAIAAPIGFALISILYFRRFAFTTPLQTAAAFLATAVVLELSIVALMMERSFAMFASPLGTWIPFALIFASTYFTGRAVLPGNRFQRAT